MASVHLNFTVPQQKNLVSLFIEEAPTKTGVYTQIEEITAIGTYPDYISEYTTSLATSATNWFRIRWKDNKNAFTDYSEPYQGGTTDLISELVARILLRDPSINETVAMQEAEAVSEYHFGVDPHTVVLSGVSYQVLSGLTLLAMVRAYVIGSKVSSSGDDYTAGLVSQRVTSASGIGRFDLQAMIEQANLWLGTQFSVIGLIEDIPVAGGLAEYVSTDQSRLLIEIE